MTAYPEVAGGDIIYAATINDILKYSINRRHCSLRQQSGQTITNGTETAITFGSGSEDFDDYGWHSTSSNTSRITPDIPGKYLAIGQVVWSFSTTITRCGVGLAKNGSTFDSSGNHKPNSTNGVATLGGVVIAEVDLNGSTDYVEVTGIHQSSGSVSQVTNVNGSGYSKLSVILLHYA